MGTAKLEQLCAIRDGETQGDGSVVLTNYWLYDIVF